MRTYEIRETKRAKIVGGINGSRRKWGASFDVYETTGGRNKLVMVSPNRALAEKRLSYLREHLS